MAILRPSQAGEGGAVVASFGTVKLNPDWNGFTLKKKNGYPYDNMLIIFKVMFLIHRDSSNITVLIQKY